MNVLSLFDGMSCGQIALNRIGLKPTQYFAAEIDKYAKWVTTLNYPDTIHLNNVINVRAEHLPKIDLLIGGSPCQGFSFAGKGLNFEDERSKLFFEFVRIWNEVKIINPKVKFLLENVPMAEEHEMVITKYLGVKPIRLNSALVSAQNRERLYWTNIKVTTIPENKYIRLMDILDDDNYYPDRNKSYCIDANYGKGTNFRRYFYCGSRQLVLEKGYSPGYMTKATANEVMHREGNRWRKLTVNECEKLQTVPLNYTNTPANNNVKIPEVQRYKMLGNGWTVDIICHLLSFL